MTEIAIKSYKVSGRCETLPQVGRFRLRTGKRCDGDESKPSGTPLPKTWQRNTELKVNTKKCRARC